MSRVTSILVAGRYDPVGARDSVVLDRAQRNASHGIFISTNGVRIEVSLPAPSLLRSEDALVLDDGTLVEVIAQSESLFEIRVPDIGQLARLAWQLGDRHVPVQVLPKRLRVARDVGADEMIRRFGFEPRPIEAPFEPEGGAYRVAPAGHEHHHDDGHDHHDHDHHDHHHDHEPGKAKA